MRNDRTARTNDRPTGTVIIVDDDGAVRRALKFALELEGMDVRLYENGADLLAAPFPPCGCLVLDYAMPAMNGIDLLAALRDRHVVLPAILIAARLTRETRRRAGISGFLAAFEKPLADSAFLDCLRQALDHPQPA